MQLIRLACVRGKDQFGLCLWAYNKKHALTKARKLLEDSGYSMYPVE